MNRGGVQIEIRGKGTETRRLTAESTRKSHGDRLETGELFQIPRFDHLELSIVSGESLEGLSLTASLLNV